MNANQKLTHSRERLLALYGSQQAYSKRTAMQELVMTILSHRTDYKSEKQAFTQMWERYGSWEAVKNAEVAELTALLSPARFPEVKAPYIINSLQQIYEETGGYDLSFLASYSPEEALKWLNRLPGVGPKTATLLLLFNFKMPVLPVDTHVHRVTLRVGILPPRTSAEKAHKFLLERLPKDVDALFTFHKHFFWHGQRACHYSSPKCSICPLNTFCNHALALKTISTTDNPLKNKRPV